MKELKELLQTVRTMALGLAMMLLSIGLMLSGIVMSQRAADPRITNNMLLLFYVGVFLLLVGFFKTIAGWKEGNDLLAAPQSVPAKAAQAHSAPDKDDTSAKKPCTNDVKPEGTLSEEEEL